MSNTDFEILQPKGWASPQGYANGIAAEGRFVFIAGQVGWDAEERMAGDDIVAQTERALKNIVAVLAEAGGKPQHLTRLTWFVTDKEAYLGRRKEIGAAYRRVIGRHFPAMSLLVVAGLVEDRALVEIEATAVIPFA